MTAFTRADAEAAGWTLTIDTDSGEASRAGQFVQVFSDTPEASLLALLAPADPAQLAAAQAAANADTQARAQNRTAMVDRATQAIVNLLAAADALDANTATPGQQRAALSLCCRTTARLVRLTLNQLDQAAT